MKNFIIYTVQTYLGICIHIFLLYIKIRAEKGLFINNIVYSISQCVRKIHQVDWTSNSAFWPGIESLSKHWDHPSVYPMVLKLLITRGNITLIPREATQEKEKEILNPQKEKLKIKEKQNMKEN